MKTFSKGLGSLVRSRLSNIRPGVVLGKPRFLSYTVVAQLPNLLAKAIKDNTVNSPESFSDHLAREAPKCKDSQKLITALDTFKKDSDHTGLFISGFPSHNKETKSRIKKAEEESLKQRSDFVNMIAYLTNNVVFGDSALKKEKETIQKELYQRLVSSMSLITDNVDLDPLYDAAMINSKNNSDVGIFDDRAVFNRGDHLPHHIDQVPGGIIEAVTLYGVDSTSSTVTYTMEVDDICKKLSDKTKEILSRKIFCNDVGKPGAFRDQTPFAVLVKDKYGAIHININYEHQFASPVVLNSVSAKEREEAYEALWEVSKVVDKMVKDKECQEFIIKTGDLLVSKNTRQLHGRNKVQKGERTLLRGHYCGEKGKGLIPLTYLDEKEVQLPSSSVKNVNVDTKEIKEEKGR